MGQPGRLKTGHIRRDERTRGTETSKYPQEKKIRMIAQVVASERAGAQTAGVSAPSGLKDCNRTEEREVEPAGKRAAEGESPVHEILSRFSSILSRAGHVKSCPKPRGPSRKAKYTRETDSEPVP